MPDCTAGAQYAVWIESERRCGARERSRLAGHDGARPERALVSGVDEMANDTVSVVSVRVALVMSFLALAPSACGETLPRATTPGKAEFWVAGAQPTAEATTEGHSDSPLLQEMKALGPQLKTCQQLEGDDECEAWNDWRYLYWGGVDYLPAAQSARIESELCALLDSPNWVLRLAGAVGLAKARRPIRSVEHATRVIKALEDEEEERVLLTLRVLTEWIDFRSRRDLSARYVALLDRARADPQRLDALLPGAAHVVGVGGVLLTVFDETPEQRSYIMLITHGMEPSDACPIFERSLKVPDRNFFAVTIEAMSSGPPCPALWDQAIAWIAKTKMPTASAATDGTGNLKFTPVGVMERYCRQPLSPGQRARLLRETKRFITPPGPAVVRNAALFAVLQCDPGSRPFVEQYTSDPDRHVAEFAQGLLKATATP